MLEKYYFSQKGTTDLRMVNCGIEQCVPNFRWGPGIRDHFILHLVLSGKGTFKTKNREYILSKNSGFLVCPGEITEYRADAKDPWQYVWVGFDGIRARSILLQADLGSHNPDFELADALLLLPYVEKMLTCNKMTTGRDEMLLGLLYQFLSDFLNMMGPKDIKTKESVQEDYVKKSVDYISSNYSRSFSVTDLASYTGLDRSYLYTLFIKYLHKSPKNYITEFRIKKAIDLMSTNLSVQEISRSVGYEDALLFSKVFKTHTGNSPIKYRKLNFTSISKYNK